MSPSTDNELIIDFHRALKTFTESKKTKKTIIFYFLICMSLGVLFYFIIPKKYTSETEILIKKTASTNLSDLDPFTLSEKNENDSDGNSSAVKNSLSEEIEILKSPLVIDITVKENNLRYENGPAKGKYLTAKDFVRKNFNISKLKDADIIYMSYKSKNPVLSYNVLNSVINNYKKLQAGINTEKASNDTVFLKKAYLNADRELNLKINKLKQYKKHTDTATESSSADFTLLGLYDKRFKAKLNQISADETDLKKLESEVSEKTDELNILKKKLDRSSLVKEMSKKTTDILILQSPEIKEKYDFSEPQPIVIFILSLLGWIFACFVLINFKLLV